MKFRIPHILKKTHSVLFAATLVLAAVLFGAVSVEAAPKGKPREFTVVIDAGHGGHDHGAIDNGTREKDINLGVARKLAALVKKKMKNVKVVMTRDDDTFISLQERANIANRNKGNLFISIHTNSVDKNNPNRKKVAGTSVYALGPQKDANNLKVAQRENSVIELESNYHQKYSGFDPSKDESYIIFEMAQKKSLGQSLRFADKAQKELVKTAGRQDRGVKQAGFWVLWATSMPSVLVELDFICNPKTAAYLASDSGQQELATALFNALKQYVENQGNSVAADIAPAQTTPAAQTVTAPESDTEGEAQGVGTLVAAEKRESGKRNPHVAQARSRSTASGQRRRRSDAARQASESRDLAADKIELKSETDYLAIQEKPEVKKEEPAPEPEQNPKDRKNKKKGNKKKTADKAKNSRNTKTAASKKSNSPKEGKKQQDNKNNKKKGSSGRKGSNTRTITVKSSGNSGPITPVVNDGGTRASTASQPAAAAMTYQIVLVASDRELAKNDPAFCGLIPTGMFVENGKYKYTYGDTPDRRQIEKKLLEVKTLIPDAVIIVRNK